MYNEICTVVCDNLNEYQEIVGILQSNEDCDGSVNNNGVYEVWGVRKMNCGNADYIVHVYVIDQDMNRF